MDCIKRWPQYLAAITGKFKLILILRKILQINVYRIKDIFTVLEYFDTSRNAKRSCGPNLHTLNK